MSLIPIWSSQNWNIKKVNVSVTDLTVSAKTKKGKDPVELIKNVSFQLPSGSLMAILGGSGSGKTTLLNILSNRTTSNLIQTGKIIYADDYDNIFNFSSINHSYVIQQDILLSDLTAIETLQYAADLRLTSSISQAERKKFVNQIILELGLKDCANTLVGNSAHKGLSGGEKRRLSIGIQLLSNPSLLFLDEPTTGLDSFSALQVILTLKKLSKSGRTIIMSLHQPRADIFEEFDYICLLSEGYPVYYILSYFQNLGFQPPKNSNIPDYLIDSISVDKRNPVDEKKTRERLSFLVEQWKLFEQKALFNSNDKIVEEAPFVPNESTYNVDPNQTIQKAGFLREISVLTKRTFLLSLRDPITQLSLILEAILLSIICGWVFLKPGDSLTGIRTKTSAIYTAVGLQGYLMLLFETYRLCVLDIKIFDREKMENCVSILGFVLSRIFAHFLTEGIAIPFLFSTITFFMFGLHIQADSYFIYLSINTLNHFIAMGSALLCTSISREFPIASLIANFNFTLQSFACGFFVNAKTMPVYVRWTKYIAYVWYGFGAAISNEFSGYLGDCPNCQPYTGKYILNTLGFNENWIAIPILILLCWGVGYYIMACVVLKIKKVDVSLSKQRGSNKLVNLKGTKDELINKDTNQIGDANAFTETGFDKLKKNDDIIVSLEKICLAVSVRTLSFKFRDKNPKTKNILNSISCKFLPGKINVIMGPSGSGKSSLLTLLSGKLSSDFINKYSYSGDIFFNKYKVTENNKLVNSICSYVYQDDDSLLPTLTVKETLKFAADLRLSNLSKEIRDKKVEEIIMKLGLKDCANTPIGSEFLKGISGGEKRRVSIGIQLLNDPKILLLDEPTSGLDSFSALYILLFLDHLAKNENKTIILTIHQPRYDLFKTFGSILVLSKSIDNNGGKVIYNGNPNSMMEYFKNLGFFCPQFTNVTDYVLDLIGINYQKEDLEIETKQRTEFLIKSWENNTKDDLILSDSDFKKELDLFSVFGVFLVQRSKFFNAYFVLLKRQSLTVIRDKNAFFARISQVAGIGIITALFFARLSNDYIGVTNRLGLLQEITPLYFIGMLNNVSSYPNERDFFYKEYKDNVYGVSAFFLSYLTLELPFELFSSVIYAVFMVFVIGLPYQVDVFLALVYVSWMIVNCGESLGIIVNTIFNHVGFAVNVISVFLSIATFMAGIMSLDMPGFLNGINWLSPLNYAIMAVTNLVFINEPHFTCRNGEGMSSDGSCIFNNGADVLRIYRLERNYKVFLLVLVFVIIIYRMIGYAVLKVKLMKLTNKVV
ncbi:uncharacterized protein ASCRUDRAFT_38135 [Ascoidea rubescens DSM 1968]|uniref:p-loop containing nucleoside triphosphate hydrolase protein n=1 Tax=Ascoidea rubescens DSM 1968 TaxID=1344418 RepID=A0A1D2VBH2_9ASCO|nr:P-loop containing nucleoside triphosphate hydrolase protein [Ascoidea rubescens DSM 1968]ODV58976.1 P-loop containing nucleoside triphosphate hydrolase protein [Ascoidea rubescens DSM 1968]